jgi:hypothetical protein
VIGQQCRTFGVKGANQLFDYVICYQGARSLWGPLTGILVI